MIELPKIHIDRIACKVKPAAERHIHAKHPWIFNESIVSQKKHGKVGDLAIIFDQKKDQFLAAGLYDPDSPIRIKLLQYHDSASIDAKWFAEKIQQAYDIRKPLLVTDTNAYRLLFGENDGLPGFICDVYDDVAVVKLYSAIWFPWLKEILPAIKATSGANHLLLRLSRNCQTAGKKLGLEDGSWLHGDPKEEVIFTEHGIRFKANVVKGHKTGFFLDHRHNRKRIGELSKGKTVLDVFSYAGGFSVHALAGGAKEVTSLDVSGPALELAKENVALNTHKGKHLLMKEDAFTGMEALINKKKQYDIVIIDPPSFAKSKKEAAGAIKHYRRLAELGVALVKREGILLLASCSARVSADEFFEVSLDVLDKSGSNYEILDKTFHDVDHPIGFAEGAYLKALYVKVKE